ncbi:Glutathione synthase/RimK-type ligase, ATP-grasp superfamily [Mesobacillus persicus]|uniref:Glutathione synthase/RimK-type ligase, ATP-grasp superfamily n=1 Tax=Mesobacillus persicus TaxID=930146 RepID=A0A1H8DY13_9BACI|nr:YheC/YheD family protein [Mesobacillus persicus]SEN11437.1 Glutathione synthase/RimK-type ligase, ATP-grasp superfamily [Mesobacillus persicus]
MEHSMMISNKRIIAVLTEISEGEGVEPSFRTIHSFCEELNQLVTESGGFFYVFSLKDISEETISGFYFNGERWRKAKLPFPDMIYNRIHSRWAESSKNFKALMEKAEEANIQVCNHRFLSKWEVHSWLIQRKNLHTFLPATELFTKTTFLKLLEVYDDLYIKPLAGSQGRGIYWLTNEGDRFKLSFSDKEGMNQLLFPSSKEILTKLTGKLGSKAHLIQQGIPLLQWEGKRLDFRVLCHRTGLDKWDVTSVVARLSAENQFASNLALGGEQLRPQKILSLIFGKDTARSKLSLMKELALEAADCISENMNGLMVELGVDIGIDSEGNLWIIEVNSKPSKNLGEPTRGIRPSAKAIIAYFNTSLDERSEGDF